MVCVKRQPSTDAASRERVTKDEAFLLGVSLARAVPQLRVNVPVGPERHDRVVFDGRLLCEDGVEVF